MDIFIEAYTLIQLRDYSIANYHIFSHFEKKIISNDVYYTKGCKVVAVLRFIVVSGIVQYSRIIKV
jgi:hypothetical protein